MTLSEVAVKLAELYGNSQPSPETVNEARKIIQDYADEHTRFVMEELGVTDAWDD